MLWVSFVLFDCRPLGIIAVAVEAGEDHRTLIEPGNQRKQFGHRRDAADQSRGDHRMARRRAAPSRGLLFQQAIAPRCRVESLFLGENPGPMLRQDLKKLVDDAPMLRQPLRDQIGDPREACSLGRDPIEKPGEARRECGGLSGQERLLARRSPQCRTSRVSSRRRRNSGIGGGTARSSAPPSDNDSSSESRSPIGRIRGSSNGVPATFPSGATRRNASRSERTARRVGSRTVMRGSSKRIGSRHPEQPGRQRRQKRPVRSDRIDLGLHWLYNSKPC